jgi:hypothetical protein
LPSMQGRYSCVALISSIYLYEIEIILTLPVGAKMI